MPRRMTPAPANVMIAKTTRGTWVALEEIWSEDGELLELRPMRPEVGQPIIQQRERRDVLARVENALMRSRLQEYERRLKELTSKPDKGPQATGQATRYANTG